jgi:hypothetical protein
MRLINRPTPKIIFLLLSIASCTKESGTSESAPPPAAIPKLEPGVFIAGLTQQQGGQVWHSDQAFTLPESSAANAIYISGPDIYTAGYGTKLTSGTQTNGICDGECFFDQVAKYWKNGTGVELTDPLKGNSYANSIFVAGSDVYVVGQQGIIPAFAVLWKNGMADTLTDGTHSGEARSVFVSGSDVYVCGQDGYQYIAAVAKYWKNGTAVDLTDGKKGAAATSITVSGNDVYVAGFEGNDQISVAKYWKNGVAVNLTDGSHWAEARSIFVSGSDVYVAGFDNYAACYWKNGEKVIISRSQGDIASAESIFLSGNNLYIVGNDFVAGSFLWKNGGVEYTFPLNPQLDPALLVKSIFVIPDGLDPLISK